MNNKINELVLYYEKNKENIKKNWNETETRIELINPFFECLGWDVNNTQKLADPFKEVKHEASLKIGTNVKAPDYSFNYGKKIFYLEAKKPSVDIKHDIHPAYQLRRYGWTAKLPISILTDFEELSIYDCRVKPDKNDNAGIARLKFYTANDYINKWDEIYNFISKEAILHGSLNEFENKEIKGTASIDDDFLNYIEDIRKLLALDIAKRNTDLSENDFNFAIQMIIDRIIFIRICEDRGIENYESLKDAVSTNNCYSNIIELFQKADAKYNSGLFHFKKEIGRNETPDSITQNLKIDDRVLKEIINGLYYPDCPFALDVISSDVLGSVYERFLGKVITLSESHKAKIDYKPEVRKAGGVYYTPHYIVEYIVGNTVGELIKNKTPDQIGKIKILDPACGSGSFLVEAYQYLLDHHLNYYHNNDPDKWKKGKEPKIFESQTGLHLTLSERKRILLNNIFGVDIDKQAVEVTKLSLLLKVLEYEGLEVKQKSLFDERVLPDLYKNIKCGNSLIGNDFYNDKDLSLFGNDEMQKVNAFDWEKEFEEVFKSGGFDCVIGNPPYVFGGNYGIEDIEKNYFKNIFVSGIGKINLFTILIEKSLNLIKKYGLVSFIIPNTFLRVTSYINIRKFVLENYCIKKINDLGTGIFEGATTSSIIILIENQNNLNNSIEIYHNLNEKIIDIKQKNLLNNGYIISTNISDELMKLFDKIIRKTINLGDICKELIFGVVISNNKDKVVSNLKIDGYKPFLEGRDISRYYINPINKYLLYKAKLLHRARTPEIFESKEKLLIQRITGGKKPLNAAFDNQKFYNKESINNLILKDDSFYNIKFILGLLNSILINWFYNNKFTNASTLTVNISKEYLSRIPIPKLDFSNPSEKQSHDKLVSLVDRMLDLQKKFHSVKTDNEKKVYKNQIDNTDEQIDALVYELYGLTEDEIKIVEGK